MSRELVVVLALLAVEPGRYSFGDFVKVGVPFTLVVLVVLVVSVLLVPVLQPF